jgi:hypothetical protein
MLDYWVQQARHEDYVRDADHARLVHALSRPTASAGATNRFLAGLGERLIMWGCRLQAYAAHSRQQTAPLDTA